MEITAQELKEIYRNSREEDRKIFLKPLNTATERFHINTPYRLSAFLGQIGHESAELRCTCENLNYSSASLVRLFGKYFNKENAEYFKYRPREIANRIYARRMGNGDEKSGDGWRYRGRGLIQLTGKKNYLLLSEALGENFVDNPDKVLQPYYAAVTSGWFWQTNGLNELSDGLVESDSEKETFRRITKRINGGYNGVEHRWELYTRAKTVLM